MLRSLVLCVLVAALSLVSTAPALRAADEPHPQAAQVVVVYNTESPESELLANYYRRKRGIPEGNLIGLPLPPAEQIDRATFTRTLYNPLKQALVQRGLVKPFDEVQPDTAGRLQFRLLQNKVRYVVLCLGVPLHVKEDPSLHPPAPAPGPDGKAPGLQPQDRNEASVDAELAALLLPNAVVPGLVPNPLFRNQDRDADSATVLRVCRLDGPSYRDARSLIDSAIEAEQRGLRGRAYLDQDGRTGGFAQGNDWLARIEQMTRELGYDTVVEKTPATFPIGARFDAPALYFGWYSEQPTGPFTLPDLRFPPGAIAVHIHSFSATTLRSRDKQWCGPLIARGVAATLGNTAEPYLTQSHQLDAFFGALGMGWNFGDAAYVSIVGLSWNNVMIGDPLYQPFKYPLEESLKQLGHPESLAWDPYAVIRAMNLVESKGGTAAEAQKLGRSRFFKVPGPALALRLADGLVAGGESGIARRYLGTLAQLERIDSDQWMLAADVADKLVEVEGGKEATRIYRTLLDDKRLPKGLVVPLLERANRAASKAGETAEATRWRAQLIQIREKKP